MGFITNALTLFKPDDFKDNNYGWLTNQLAHVKGSYVLSVFVFSICIFLSPIVNFVFKTNTIADVFNASVGVVVFWLLWESRHLYISKNIKDFFEDLFFELSGVALFYLVFSVLPKEYYVRIISFNYLLIVVTSILYYKRTKTI